MWKDIKAILGQYTHFVLTTHVNPDGDGLGAACALIELLRLQGKNVRFVSDSPISEKFTFLDYHNCFETFSPQVDWSSEEVLIILDTHCRERIGRLSQLLDSPGVVSICIDHHRLDKIFTPYAAIDSAACSVGAMVYTLFKESGFSLNLNAATGIYVSIVCDTGRFSYSSTSRKAHKIADECIKLGVDPNLVYRQIYQQVPFDEMQGFIRSMGELEMHFERRVLLLPLDQNVFEGSLQHMDLEFVLDISKQIREVECVVVLRISSDQLCRVSLRSKGSLDVSKVARALGGGGHGRAAGATVVREPARVKEEILELLGEQLDGIATDLIR